MKNKLKSKSDTIILRVDQKMKYEITKLAEENRRELSNYLRLIIEDTIKNKTKV
jgi:hypothetical protein